MLVRRSSSSYLIPNNNEWNILMCIYNLCSLPYTVTNQCVYVGSKRMRVCYNINTKRCEFVQANNTKIGVCFHENMLFDVSIFFLSLSLLLLLVQIATPKSTLSVFYRFFSARFSFTPVFRLFQFSIKAKPLKYPRIIHHLKVIEKLAWWLDCIQKKKKIENVEIMDSISSMTHNRL